MSTQDAEELRPIRHALLSVSDKTGLIEFARALQSFNIKLISTGGTAKALRDAGLPVRDVADVTGFPEMLDGRVKTLHPRIHGGLLARRDDPAHNKALADHGIDHIDMVVVNLYPFEETIARQDVTLEEAIEQIDIGGPAMIRSAAKNWKDVAVIVSTGAYAQITEELRQHNGALSSVTRGRLARLAFERTAFYDISIFAYLSNKFLKDGEPIFSHFNKVLGIQGGDEAFLSYLTAGAKETPSHEVDADPAHSTPSSSTEADDTKPSRFPDIIEQTFVKLTDLRYGENPHQLAALYHTGEGGGVAFADQLSGKEMSFNNYVDADAAWQLVCDFDETACAIIKHTNAAGVALGASAEAAYRRALETDPVSAFGGIVAFNCQVNEVAARAVSEIFTEVVIAPGYDEKAVEVLRTKKNLRILRTDKPAPLHLGLNNIYRSISGGMLVQTPDTRSITRDQLQVVTARQPTDEETASLLFAWIVCKHTKSNAIVFAYDNQTIGVGAGQMSRVDSVRLAAMRARLPVEGSALASDAFFPFRDGVDLAAEYGITAIIQPGGSLRDEEVIAAANEHNIAMVFTGVRHFKH